MANLHSEALSSDKNLAGQIIRTRQSIATVVGQALRTMHDQGSIVIGHEGNITPPEDDIESRDIIPNPKSPEDDIALKIPHYAGFNTVQRNVELAYVSAEPVLS